MLTSIAITALSIAAPALFAWVVNVQSRVSILETENRGLRDLIEEKFDGLEKSLNFKHEVNERRLDRIERSLNGSLLKY